jgi:sodium transport system permease protein
MSLSNIGIVYRKELKDSLRDRRTLISMVAVPILIMPLMSIGIGTLMIKIIGEAKQEVPRVMILGGTDSPKTREALLAMKDVKFEPGTPDYKDQISEKKVRAAVELPPGFDAALNNGDQPTVKIYDYEGDLKSGFASDKIEKFFETLKKNTVQERLIARKLPESLIKPFEVKTQNVAPPEKVTGAALGGLIPYFIIILCLTGAMYPAIDLTAGEKERGTIETILCSRVSRTHLVLGKFLMVLTASLTTAILAMISMGFSFMFAKKLIARMATGTGPTPFQFTIGLKAIFAVFLMVLPVAVFFSAALLAIALFAKSYKEAQTYISPLMIVAIIPAIAGMLPGTELSGKLALIPVLNTSLVCKEIVSGTYHWHLIGQIFLTTALYAVVALWIAVKLFKREDVLFRT